LVIASWVHLQGQESFAAVVSAAGNPSDHFYKSAVDHAAAEVGIQTGNG
jgi:hypothetical protein